MIYIVHSILRHLHANKNTALKTMFELIWKKKKLKTIDHNRTQSLIAYKIKLWLPICNIFKRGKKYFRIMLVLRLKILEIKLTGSPIKSLCKITNFLSEILYLSKNVFK